MVWNQYLLVSIYFKTGLCVTELLKIVQYSLVLIFMLTIMHVVKQEKLSSPIMLILNMFKVKDTQTQNEMMWTAGIQMKWVCDHRSESQFKQLRKSPKKRISGLQRDSNPWPLR